MAAVDELKAEAETIEEAVNDTKKRLEIAREKRGNLLKEKIKQKSVKREER